MWGSPSGCGGHSARLVKCGLRVRRRQSACPTSLERASFSALKLFDYFVEEERELLRLGVDTLFEAGEFALSAAEAVRQVEAG